MDAEGWLADNRANWDDRAALHVASGYGMPELLADPDHITPEVAQDRDVLGDLSGRAVIHLQCHLGTDTLSLARMGASRVVGVDLSPASLARARDLATRAGSDIDYVEANVYDAREAVSGDFDLVYTSLGVLCWLPDVERWARVVASLLRPGGRLFIRDDHPMFMAVGEDTTEGLRLEQPYFQQVEPMTWEDEGSYVQAPAGTPPMTHRVSHQWSHSIGEILTAVLDAGLVIDSFTESDHSGWCPWPGLMVADERGWRLARAPERIALQFALSAHRPPGLRG